jgi:hypothetical protein
MSSSGAAEVAEGTVRGDVPARDGQEVPAHTPVETPRLQLVDP